MAANVMSDEERIGFLLACIETIETRPDWGVVGEKTGMKKDTARMRFTRIKQNYEKRREATEAAAAAAKDIAKGTAATPGEAVDGGEGSAEGGEDAIEVPAAPGSKKRKSAGTGTTPKTPVKTPKKRVTAAKKKAAAVAAKDSENESIGGGDENAEGAAEVSLPTTPDQASDAEEAAEAPASKKRKTAATPKKAAVAPATPKTPKKSDSKAKKTRQTAAEKRAAAAAAEAANDEGAGEAGDVHEEEEVDEPVTPTPKKKAAIKAKATPKTPAKSKVEKKPRTPAKKGTPVALSKGRVTESDEKEEEEESGVAKSEVGEIQNGGEQELRNALFNPVQDHIIPVQGIEPGSVRLQAVPGDSSGLVVSESVQAIGPIPNALGIVVGNGIPAPTTGNTGGNSVFATMTINANDGRGLDNFGVERNMFDSA